MDVLLIMLWSLVSQQFLNLIQFLMRICGFPLLKTSLKFSSRNFVSFYVDGYTFMPSTYNV